MNRDTSGGFFAGVMIGAFIGLAVGFLYAPQEGKETRRLVKEKAADIREATARAARKMREAAESSLKREE